MAAAARELTQRDPQRAEQMMSEALSLWRGPVLAEYEYEQFGRETTLRLDEIRIALMEDRLATRIDLGPNSDVIADLEALAVEHPFRERLACLLMTALFRTGRQAEALRACSRLRANLAEELGIDPSESTRDLEQRILEQDATLLASSPGPITRPPVTKLRDFELLNRVGDGRFGVVYRAREVSVGRDVALKSIRSEYANNPDFLRRFEAEAQIVARVEHPHIVPLYGFWRDPDGAYLVMRLMRGGSLRESLDVGRWRPDRLVRLVEQVAAGAHAAHRQGVIHRDIKPANILLDEDGNGYLSDFGIAKFLDAAQTLTTGGIPITPAYVAPEILVGPGAVSPRSDVYSLALVTFEALTGQHPYPTESLPAMINHQLHDPLPATQSSPAVDEVLARGAAKNPEDRYDDIRAFAEALSIAVSGEEPGAEVAMPNPGLKVRRAEPTLEDYINETAPFGPIAMDEILDAAIYRDLYDSDNRIHAEIMQRNPSFIVGRRGAGKTALMRVPLLDPTNVLVEFKSSDLFAQVLACVEALERRGGRIFANQIGDIWEGVVWTGLCLATLRAAEANDMPHPELRTVQRYVAGYGEADALSVDRVAAEHCRKIGEAATLRGLTTIGLEVTSGGVALMDAKAACQLLLESSGLHPVVLIDSMEDLHAEVYTLARVLAGLFGFIGRIDRAPQRDVQLRLCYPSELWSKLSDFAANPLKDAENHIMLFWHARELIKIAGHRLSLYMGLYHPETLQELFGREGYNPKSFEDARLILGAVLPREIVNQFGQVEITLAYILRHTQLLPRHLLRILNGIMRRNREDGDGNPLTVEASAVTDGMNRVKELLVTEIFTAYSAAHPAAREICRRVIPELGAVFAEGELHRTYNQTGIRKASGMEYFDFKEMLLEIGCLGRVVGYTDRYVEGEFDYTLPTPLFPATEDDLCLHPLFSWLFQAKQNAGDQSSVRLPVYPYGADPDHKVTW
jgi:serine/threonine protein kinase